MKKILYINGNPQAEELSFSGRVGKYYLNQLNNSDNNVSIDLLNTYEEEIPFIDADVLDAWHALQGGEDFSDLTAAQQEKVGRMGALLNRFKSADEYIIVTPLWNFSIPPMLKAFIDNVMIAGETFEYTENGPVGMLVDKKATIIQASGGIYSSGPAAGMESGSNYIKTVLGFMGVKNISTVLIEGVAIPNKTEEEKLASGYRQVDQLFDFDLV